MRPNTTRWIVAVAAGASLALCSAAAGQQQPPPPVHWPNSAVYGGDIRPGTTLADRWRVDKTRWQTWGPDVATGAGMAQLFDPPSAAFKVTVTLSEPVDCHGFHMFTRLTAVPVEGELPPGRDAGELNPLTRTCSIQPQLCGERSACRTPPKPQAFERRGEFDLYLGALDQVYGTRIFPVGMRWKGLNTSVATGTGYLNTRIKLGTGNQILQDTGEEPRVYPIRATLSDPAWCGGFLRYTTLRVDAYGAGIARSKGADTSKSPSASQRPRLERDRRAGRARSSTVRRGGGRAWIKPAAEARKALGRCAAPPARGARAAALTAR